MTKLQAATDTVKELLCWYVGLLFIAAGIYMVAEHTSLDDAIYWACTTATSTGYGDLSPKTIVGRIDAVILMHISIFVIAPMMIVRLIDNMRVDQNAFTDAEQRDLLARVISIQQLLGPTIDSLEEGMRRYVYDREPGRRLQVLDRYRKARGLVPWAERE